MARLGRVICSLGVPHQWYLFRCAAHQYDPSAFVMVGYCVCTTACRRCDKERT